MSNNSRPDAFKEMMAAARAAGRPELGHQGRGRPLSKYEDQLADALMEIYSTGTKDPDAVARELLSRNLPRPSTGQPDWSADTLTEELQSINADLDAAYSKNGFGA